MIKSYIFRILFVFILFVLLTYSSYYRSKLAAEELVGDTIEYFQLSQTKITIEPLERNQIVWSFKFSYLDTHTFDEEFYIYTSLWGSVVTTNPKNLENMIRESEKLEIHPYYKKVDE